MGYRITYAQNMVKTSLPSTQRKFIHKKLISITMLCLFILLLCFSGKVRSALLPGDPQITEKALITLADDIKQGDAVSDAVTAFCRTILENA